MSTPGHTVYVTNIISGEVKDRNTISGNVSQALNRIDECSGEISPVLEINGNIEINNSINGDITYPCPEQHDEYAGNYEVTPKKGETVLLTKDKLLLNDVVVLEVPYAAVSNEKGGYTVTIL